MQNSIYKNPLFLKLTSNSIILYTIRDSNLKNPSFLTLMYITTL